MRRFLMIALILLAVTSLFAQPNRFELEKGMFKMKITSDFMTGTSTSWFDQNGERMVNETQISINMGGNSMNRDITTIRDGQTMTIMFNDQKSYFTDSIGDEEDEEEVFQPDEDTKIGTGEVLGRTCDIYQDGTTKTWMYKGIPMKMVNQEEGMTLTMEVIEFSENTGLDESKLSVPDGYTENESMKQLMQGGMGGFGF